MNGSPETTTILSVQTFGNEQFAATNEKLTSVFRRRSPVIMAHRGASSGPIPENTSDAAHAAFLSGADIVEIDVIASRDGQAYVFHTGTEVENLGLDVRLEEFTADEIDELQYRLLARGGRAQRIEKLEDFLLRFRETEQIFNIDRSWHLWPDLLDTLTALDMTDQLLLKCPAPEEDAIRALTEHATPFPFMLLCRSEEHFAVASTLSENLNLVGFELISQLEQSVFHQSDFLSRIHEQGFFTLANAQVHGDSNDLFSGWDDEVSLAEGPDRGWGRLFDHGFLAIQTDWPWLVRDYRELRAARRL